MSAPGGKTRAAAIDIGSNSILLTIAEVGTTPSGIPLRLLHDEAQVTGLSKGLSVEGFITETAQNRAQPVLTRYAKLIQEMKASATLVTGTEAFRRAKNGNEVKTSFEKILGSRIEIISGDREAELSFWSVQKELSAQNLDRLNLVFDIGGASTELCLGNSDGIQQRISLKVGSVVLAEKFKLNEVCDPAAAISYVQEMIDRDVPWKTNVFGSTGIGVAGTITTLIAMEQRIDPYVRAKVHGQSISVAEVRARLENLCSKTPSQRAEHPGLPIDRADVITGGVSIALGLMQKFEWPKIACMDSGVRFGALYELLGV